MENVTTKNEEEVKIWKNIPHKKISSIEIKYNLENNKGRFEQLKKKI